MKALDELSSEMTEFFKNYLKISELLHKNVFLKEEDPVTFKRCLQSALILIELYKRVRSLVCVVNTHNLKKFACILARCSSTVDKILHILIHVKTID